MKNRIIVIGASLNGIAALPDDAALVANLGARASLLRNQAEQVGTSLHATNGLVNPEPESDPRT